MGPESSNNLDALANFAAPFCGALVVLGGLAVLQFRKSREHRKMVNRAQEYAKTGDPTNLDSGDSLLKTHYEHFE